MGQQDQALVKAQIQKVDKLIQAYQSQFQQALPKHLNVDNFLRIVLTAIRKNPKLATCDQASFIGGVMQLAQLGLAPDNGLGHAYLIPFRNNKKGITEAQVVIGYRGLVDLARRSGEIESVYAQSVHANDMFEYGFGTRTTLDHKPKLTDRGKVIAYYAVAKFKGGDAYQFEIMSVEDVIRHRNRYSKGYKADDATSPWNTEPDEMGKKTVLRKLCKMLPLSVDLEKALLADGATFQKSPDDDNVFVPDFSHIGEAEAEEVDGNDPEAPKTEALSEAKPTAADAIMRQAGGRPKSAPAPRQAPPPAGVEPKPPVPKSAPVEFTTDDQYEQVQKLASQLPPARAEEVMGMDWSNVPREEAETHIIRLRKEVAVAQGAMAEAVSAPATATGVTEDDENPFV